MRGLTKKKLNRGIVIKVGGVYNYPKMTFNFTKQGIIDKKTFEAVTNGFLVKYVEKL